MKPALPKSETSLVTNIFGYVCALATIYLLADKGLTAFDLTLAVLLVSATPVLLIEGFYFKRNREAYAQLGANREPDHKRIFIKFIGLLGIFAGFGTLYALLAEYDKPLYNVVWPFYLLLLTITLVVTPFYFRWCDRHQDDPEDGYYQLGQWMLLRKPQKPALIKPLLRNWLVKAFFLPLMFSYSVDSINNLQHVQLGKLVDFLAVYFVAVSVIMFADLLYATLGYIFTLRIFNAHIRSSEPTFFGWFVAIICYPPFWNGLFFGAYFMFDDSVNWYDILPQGPVYYAWGIAILSCLFIYALCTVCLGIRFSNLTYRGLVTNGPYRFTKHPAYVSKNLSWWLVSMPFIINGKPMVAVAHTVALMGVNCLYYLRARTEENHLSNYPEYVEYALAMNERSIFAPLAKRLPFLRYKKPENPPSIA